MAGPLADMVRAKYPGAYDDLSDGDLEASVTAKYPGVYDDLTEPAEPAADEPGMFSMERIKEAAYKASPLPLFERENLPMTLGGVGAGVAGPGGAAVGGAAGAALRDIIGAATGAEDVPTTATGAFGNVVGEAALQGGLSKVPDVLKGGARRLYGGLLKPAKALRESFGGTQQIVEPLLERSIPLTKSGEKRIGGGVRQSRAQALQMVRAAEQGGAPGVTTRDVIQEFRPVITELQRRSDVGVSQELPRVAERVGALHRTATRGGGQIPLTRAQELKETAQEAASGAYRARERGAQKMLSADDLLDEASARGLRQAIETRVPGVGPQNQQTQRLLGPLRAVEDALGREGNTLAVGGMRDLIAMGVGGGGGAMVGGPAGAMAGGPALTLAVRALSMPSVGSMAAIAAYQAGRLKPDQLIRALVLEGSRLQDSEEP